MNKRAQCGDRNSPIPTCETCVHTFRKSRRQDMVVCVPHLKTMPADHPQVCELYSRKHKS
jgi:hypothetical protein